jgi:hypothetical protein
MRLPLPALLAILAVAAAGSIIVTLQPRQAAYTIDARALAVGQEINVTLSYVPTYVYVIGNASASYEVRVDVWAGNSTASFDWHYATREYWGRHGPIICVITVRRAS